jgi:LysR family transcriptional regulator, hydrogen peroxide-inducible genes activator
MQMHQIRYFLALCEECNFTRAAKRSGISQPSLTNAISALERELGGALFQRKPSIALTTLGRTMQPYLRRIAETADHAHEAAQAFVRVPPENSEMLERHPPASPEHSSG